MLCFPAHKYLGEAFNYFIAPYILYMVWSKKSEYYPALIIHISPGSIISFLILCSVLLLTIQNYRVWKKFKIRHIFILSLLPLPIFLWQTIDRLFIQNVGLVKSMTPLDMYLGVFPFFYGILLSRKINFEVWKGIFYVLFFSLGIEFLKLEAYSVRVRFLALPALVSLAIFIMLFRGKQIGRDLKVITILSLLYFVSKINNISLTILGTVGISSLMVIGYRWKVVTIPKLFSSKWAFIVTILLVYLAVNNQNKFRSEEALNHDYSSFDISDIDMLRSRLYKKTFDDRAPLWLAVWRNVTAEKKFLPPMNLKEYRIENLYESEHGINLGAHNVFLELLRQFGIIIGPIIGLIFILIVINAGRVLFLRGGTNSFLVISASSVVAIGVIGGMTGQYPLIITFSLLFSGLAGICYGAYFQSKFIKHSFMDH